MVELVTLEEIKRGLLIDYDDDDLALGDLNRGLSQAILNYLKSGSAAWYDSETGTVTGTVPDVVKSATIMLIGIIFREPDGDVQELFERGYLPMPVTALLYPLRDPALA